jgi:hypothetical protein
MPIARQRGGKHIPEFTLSTKEGHPFLGNGPITDNRRGVSHVIRAKEL